MLFKLCFSYIADVNAPHAHLANDVVSLLLAQRRVHVRHLCYQQLNVYMCTQ